MQSNHIQEPSPQIPASRFVPALICFRNPVAEKPVTVSPPLFSAVSAGLSRQLL